MRQDHPELADVYLAAETISSPRLTTIDNPPVRGIGVLQPRLLILGEAPGAEEAAAGRPFIGRSGKLLQSLLTQAGWSGDDLYVTNAVKHRPPNNATPTFEELSTYSSILRDEISIVQPVRILCAGRIPAQAIALLADVKLPASGLRGYEFMYGEIPVFCTWHPAYALRNPSASPQLLEDLTKVYAYDLLRG